MYISTWTSPKSLIMSEIRENLKKQNQKGYSPLTRKEANKTWREDILGILSDSQKQQAKERKQQKSKKFKQKEESE